MRILLTDASGLTSRQVANILSQKGHTVDVLSPPGLSLLTRLTRHVTRTHFVPPFGRDSYAWLDATLSIITSVPQGQKFDVLLCTQEQAAILSAELDRVRETGIKTAVPEFGPLRRVMDKVSASETLRAMEVLQPESVVLSSVEDLKDKSAYERLFPAFAKKPIATGSTGVRVVSSLSGLRTLCDDWQPFKDKGKLLLQRTVPGPLLMICWTSSHGKLVAWHSVLRTREAVNGGASIKISLSLDIVGEMLEKMGRKLGWHGGLSLDAILVDEREEKKEVVCH